ncbi:Uncharacterised protein [Halioglobus japonicus]|nr:Uncharacterised protein [Halioglobus japonicus]CAA0125149.1 Uncharacterised protein [Halioglobus japonicus]
MLTEKMHTGVAALCICLLWAVALPHVAAADDGQYRSKVLITPNEGDWAKGAGLSIEELEQQLGSIEESYAKSSAGRHLARHYVEAKQYDKAIDFYQQALAAEGLSDVANREMLRELAQVYLLKKDYPAAAQTLQKILSIDLVPEIGDFLLLARAQHHLGKYVGVVAALDGIQKAGLSMDAAQMQQALALYYHAGAFAQCEVLLGRLLELQPDDAQNWHLLASVYLQQNKKKQALDQLALARDKGVPFTERDILLLASLHAANNNPYGAADVLENALAAQAVSQNATTYRRLFEFWLQAREQQKARKALQQAAKLSGDIELYLYLAQLQMEDADFDNMYQTMLLACGKPLPDKYVGRANLLLGVSQLKLGDEVGARRSFINATLIGGVNAQAGQWLRFMDGPPATEDELSGIVGICYGQNDKQMKATGTLVKSNVDTPADSPAQEEAPAAFEIKTVPPMSLYYMQSTKPLDETMAALRGTLIKLYVSLAKSGGSADGPLQIILTGDPRSEAGVDVELGAPFRGSTGGSGRFRVRTTESFKCASQSFEGEGEAVAAALAQLAEAVKAAQHEFTGETRIVVPQSNSADTLRVELQIGIR